MLVDWSTIDTVLLDMDGTLLDLHFDNFFWQQHLPKRFAEHYGYHPARAHERLAQLFQRQQGQLNWYCLDYWSRELALNIISLKREIAHLIAARPHVVEFLEAVKGSGRRCLLVTNAHRDSLSLKLEHVLLRPYFDAIIVSHDYGVAKEAEAFWSHLQHSHPFEPQNTLLIDDNEAVLDSAQAFGIRHLLTLRQPDSRQPPRQHLSYPAIDHFDAIMPTQQCPTTAQRGVSNDAE